MELREGDSDGVAVHVLDLDAVKDAVNEAVEDFDGVPVNDEDCVGIDVLVAVTVPVAVGDTDAVGSEDREAVPVPVIEELWLLAAVSEPVGDEVLVSDGVMDGVRVADAVADAVPLVVGFTDADRDVVGVPVLDKLREAVRVGVLL